jgi:hypothetical protein
MKPTLSTSKDWNEFSERRNYVIQSPMNSDAVAVTDNGMV